MFTTGRGRIRKDVANSGKQAGLFPEGTGTPWRMLGGQIIVSHYAEGNAPVLWLLLLGCIGNRMTLPEIDSVWRWRDGQIQGWGPRITASFVDWWKVTSKTHSTVPGCKICSFLFGRAPVTREKLVAVGDESLKTLDEIRLRHNFSLSAGRVLRPLSASSSLGNLLPSRASLREGPAFLPAHPYPRLVIRCNTIHLLATHPCLLSFSIYSPKSAVLIYRPIFHIHILTQEISLKRRYTKTIPHIPQL